jgi:hypothetical protein
MENKGLNKWIKHILDYYRPKHTTVPTLETNSWGLISISCKVFRYCHVCKTHFFITFFSCSFTYTDLHFENPTTAEKNIWANIFEIPNQYTYLHFQYEHCRTFKPRARPVPQINIFNLWPQSYEQPAHTVTRSYMFCVRVETVEWCMNCNLWCAASETKRCSKMVLVIRELVSCSFLRTGTVLVEI